VARVTSAHEPSPGLTLDESARRLGELVAAKQIQFECLGSWARSVSDPTLTLVLARVSAHQGWSARLLESLLPVTRDHDPVAVVDRQRARVGAGELQAGPSDDGGNPQALVEAARAALLCLIQTAESLAGALSPVADPAARRLLQLVVESDRRDLESLADPGFPNG
jgi:hypothetical protein